MAPAKPRDRSFAGRLTGEEAERHRLVLRIEAACKQPAYVWVPLASSAPPAAPSVVTPAQAPAPPAIRVQVVELGSLID